MDIDAIKSKLATLQSTSNTKDNFWKPEPGKQVVRIVPYKHNKDNPFIELFFHYNLGNNNEWIQGKRLEPKMRTFAPVIVRGKESEGVKFWGFGKTVYQELLGVIADPDYGDITDATNGRDIGIERQTPAEAGNQYGKTTVRVKPNQTAITEDADMLQGIFDNQSNLTELYNEPTYDELKEVLQNFLNPSDETETSAPTNTTEKVAEQTATKSTADVSDAFDNLFNN